MGDTSTSNLAFPFIAIWPPEVAENEGLKLGICLCNSIETLCKLWVGPSEVADNGCCNLLGTLCKLWVGPSEVADNGCCNLIGTLCKLWVGPSEVADNEGSRSGICSSNLIIRCASE